MKVLDTNDTNILYQGIIRFYCTVS